MSTEHIHIEQQVGVDLPQSWSWRPFVMIVVAFLIVLATLLESHGCSDPKAVAFVGRYPEAVRDDLLVRHPPGTSRQALEETLRRSKARLLVTEPVDAKTIERMKHPPFPQRTDRLPQRIELGNLLSVFSQDESNRLDPFIVYVVFDAQDHILDIGVKK